VKLKAYQGNFISFCCKKKKYSKAPNLRKAKELNLTSCAAILFASAMCTRKSIVGRKGKHCADPNEIVDNYINNEFPDKIVVIKLDLFALEKDAWSEKKPKKESRKSREKCRETKSRKRPEKIKSRGIKIKTDHEVCGAFIRAL